jgi:hypothetical protein
MERTGELYRIEDQSVDWSECIDRSADIGRSHRMHFGHRHRFAMDKCILEPQRLLDFSNACIRDFHLAQKTCLVGRCGLMAWLEEPDHR